MEEKPPGSVPYHPPEAPPPPKPPPPPLNPPPDPPVQPLPELLPDPEKKKGMTVGMINPRRNPPGIKRSV